MASQNWRYSEPRSKLIGFFHTLHSAGRVSGSDSVAHLPLQDKLPGSEWRASAESTCSSQTSPPCGPLVPSRGVR